MKPVECEFESDALAAAVEDRWPGQVDADLRAHVEGCPICSDVVVIASAIDDARHEIRARVVVPESGRVWWLAQLRARREATEAAGRPITAAQFIAFACAVGLLGACFGATSTWFQSTLGWIGSSVARIDAKALVAEHGLIVLAMAAVLFFVPTAVYLALSRD